MGFIADISEGKQAEGQLPQLNEAQEAKELAQCQQYQEDSRLLAAVVESSNDAIITKTNDSIITSWNVAAEKLFGYSQAEAVGQSISILFPPERMEEETQLLEHLKRGERVDHFDTVRLRQDGTQLDVSVTISPLKDEAGRVIGASTIIRDITERKLNEKLQGENLRLGAELEVARQIQQMILPKPEELERVEGLDLAGFMEPADEVGGDYYDVLQAEGIVTLGIGDVTGHGLESGLLMLMAQTAVLTLQQMRELDPVRFLDTLNRTLYRNVRRMNSEKNLTLAILNYSEGRVSISGQHEEILLVRAGGHVERIDTMDLGLPLGLDDEIADFIDHTMVELEPGDGIVLYTDGIPEARDEKKKQYGMERLCEVISQNWQHTVEEIKQAVIEDLREFIGKQKIFDDMALVILKQQ